MWREQLASMNLKESVGSQSCSLALILSLVQVSELENTQLSASIHQMHRGQTGFNFEKSALD